jgi:GT2 family glycosyltransferase
VQVKTYFKRAEKQLFYVIKLRRETIPRAMVFLNSRDFVREQHTIAVLITCHNRVRKTLRCLNALFEAEKGNCTINVYLVDDGSTDGTALSIKENYPQVRIIPGNGELYWCGGMRRAWEIASFNFNYEFYLWLNDDVVVNKDFIERLLKDYSIISNKYGPCLLTGACCDPGTGVFTYGGRNNKNLLLPNGVPQLCRYIHGNIVLVPREIFKSIGGLSESFTHALGDTDYGLRAIRAGFTCWTTSMYVAKCRQHNIKGPWASSEIPIKKRLALLKHPLGLNIGEYKIYRKRHYPRRWLFDVMKTYIQVLFPRPFEWYSQKFIPWHSTKNNCFIDEKRNGC